MIDTIGIIYEPTGTILTDADGNEYPEMAPVAGWHINTPAKLIGLDAYLVTPATPRRQFAGHKTYCYTFADQATADAILYNETDDGKQLKPELIPDMSPVPQTVTRRQAKQQLAIAGMLDSVQPAIDAITDTAQRRLVQIYWDDSQELERNHPMLIALATGALGLTDEQIDDLFRAAVQLCCGGA